LAIVTAVAVAPLWLPLVLAVWSALLVRPIHRRVSSWGGGRNRAAGAVTVLLVVAVLTPLVLTSLALAGSAAELFTQLRGTESGDQILSALVSGNGNQSLDYRNPTEVLELLREHSTGALNAARSLFGALATGAVGLFVFVFTLYTFLVYGQQARQWLLAHVPLPRSDLVRLGSAFEETGRGLFVGLGGTALFQGALATVGYLIIGVPRAWLLGMLTAIGSLIPVVGTGLIWVPATLALFVIDENAKAIATFVLGLAVSGLDNLVRPWLARHGQLRLPTFITFVLMLGGVAAYGASGLILGPLLGRLALEALELRREHLRGASSLLSEDESSMQSSEHV
jgi:predicted PurR-regulated permease PerM